MLLMRATTLSSYLAVARSVGLDGPGMLRQAGIARETLDDPAKRVPAAAAIGLLDRSAEVSGCENFGLLMAEARSVASVGPLALLFERLPNVREMMRAAIELRGHMTDVFTNGLEDVGEACLIRLDLAPGVWSDQLFDHGVAMTYRSLVAASGGAWKPDCVHLVHKAPDDIEPWRRVFAVPIEFESTFNGLSSSSAAMQRANPNSDPTMAENARNLLNLVHVEPVNTATERVQRSIVLLLPSGRATIDHVARHMGLSPRGLQRHLDDEGQQFGGLLAGVRRELAIAYLANSAQPVATVAWLLGYSSPSSFTRWFAGNFGTSPQAWRADHPGREEAGPPPTWRR